MGGREARGEESGGKDDRREEGEWDEYGKGGRNKEGNGMIRAKGRNRDGREEKARWERG